jgi:hypothetical protein
MAIPLLLAPLIGKLASEGLDLVANAVMAKGKQKVEEVLGVELKEDMPPEQVAAIKLAAMNNEAVLSKMMEEELTKRHQADMASDSWLSKNIRPMSLIYLMLLFTLAFVMSVPETVLNMLNDLLLTVFVFYFGSRTVEKVVSVAKGKR